MPTRRLAEGETGQQGIQFRHMKTPSYKTSVLLFLLATCRVVTGYDKSIRKDFSDLALLVE